MSEATLDSMSNPAVTLDSEGQVNVPVELYKFGTWMFLTSETMLFSGIIGAYLVFRLSDPAGFSEQAHHLDWRLAATNTMALITSSLTMALAIHWAREGKVAKVKLNLLITIACGLIFMVIKGYEYNLKFEHGLLPSAHVFWACYFLATGLHGLHVVAGVLPLTYFLIKVSTSDDVTHYSTPLECMGLYWHLVDLVWIFIFPLFYLLH